MTADMTPMNDSYYSNRPHASEPISDPNPLCGSVVATTTLIFDRFCQSTDKPREPLTSETTVLRIAVISATKQLKSN